jgi:RimJ/RimL family protein N-acetyltransferase
LRVEVQNLVMQRTEHGSGLVITLLTAESRSEQQRRALVARNRARLRPQPRPEPMDAPINPGELTDGELRLVFDRFAPHTVHKVSAYYFRMVHVETADELGAINLRVGSTPHIERYAGHVGFSVQPPHRGHRYAERSLRLLFPLAIRLGLNPLWITCNPENWVSRRTLELAGAEFVEIVDVPENCVIYQDGYPKKCRYKLGLTVTP